MFVTVLGIGFIKYAPGTFGSLAALVFFIIPSEYKIISIILLVILLFLSFVPIKKSETVYGNDPSIVIIDEFIAMGLVFSLPFLPENYIWCLIEFILFRIFDIFKPFPINLLDNKKGAFFVLADDLLAALITVIISLLLKFSLNLIALFSFI